MSPVVLVSLQLFLYAMLWLIAALTFREGRAAMLHWFGYALTSTLAIALLVTRGSHPGWLTVGGAPLAFLLSLVLVRRGVDLFLQQRPHDAAYGVMTALAVVGLGWIGIEPEQAWLRSSWVSGLSIAVLLVGVPSGWRALRAEFGLGLALTAAGALAAMVLLHLSQVLTAWSQAAALAASARDVSRLPASTWFVVLVAAAVFNFLFLFMVGMRLVRRLQRQARHDPLTGLLNRRAMGHVLENEWARFGRGGPPFTLIGLDIDHFKRINDGHGHAGGDEVLRAVASQLQAAVRPVDRVARMGGEELLVLMPACAADAAGLEAAERLRAALAAAPVQLASGVALSVTASWGVSGPHPGDADAEAIMARADAALYRAKAGGRNRVEVG